MDETIPAEVGDLLARRDAARAAKDFAEADALRGRIAALGFDVRDTPQGATAMARPPFETLDAKSVGNRLGDPASLDVSIVVVYEGFRDDLVRFVDAFEARCSAHDYEIVVVDNAGPDASWLESLARRSVRVLHLDTTTGWAEAVNAGLKTCRGAVVAVADLSVEPSGDLLAPVLEAFGDPSVGLAGPWGLTTPDMRIFVESSGPEVDAIEGYFLAVRRELLATHLLDEHFRWYRHADLELSFRIRSLGSRAVAVSAPAVRHAHRGWEAVEEPDRTKRSKRNFYRFLDRWKHRTDLLTSNGPV